jgi:hypothetical protein
MNYFFGFNGLVLSTKLTIPKFQNRSKPNPNLCLWGIISSKDNWVIKKEQTAEDENFFYVDTLQIDNHKVFILATEEEVRNFSSNKLIPISNFTSTLPAYRSNFKLIHRSGGFSSYQSEYPSGMVGKKGSIISSIKSLLNIKAKENYILVRNIYHSPIIDSFDGYLIDYKSKQVLEKIPLQTNTTNCIKVEKKYLLPNVFLYTDGYLGIPIYISQDKGHLSMEHTHPPHSYILSNNVFKKVSELKKEFYEIVHS